MKPTVLQPIPVTRVGHRRSWRTSASSVAGMPRGFDGYRGWPKGVGRPVDEPRPAHQRNGTLRNRRRVRAVVDCYIRDPRSTVRRRTTAHPRDSPEDESPQRTLLCRRGFDRGRGRRADAGGPTVILGHERSRSVGSGFPDPRLYGSMPGPFHQSAHRLVLRRDGSDLHSRGALTRLGPAPTLHNHFGSPCRKRSVPPHSMC